MTQYVLGIDGGGTKTQAVIVDDSGQLCGTGLGGPSNYDDVGIDRTRTSIGQAVDAARHMADLSQTPFRACNMEANLRPIIRLCWDARPLI